MARITEDLIQTLIDMGVFNFTDLPDNAQENCACAACCAARSARCPA